LKRNLGALAAHLLSLSLKEIVMRTFALLAATGLLLLFSANEGRAGEWRQELTLTFSNPVEIPGHVLTAGTYVFEVGVGDTSQDENVVRVYNKDKNHLYGVFLTIPDHRLARSSKTILEFENVPAGQPPAIYAWFYPGDKTGHEFVYPKSEAMRLAKENNRPVASMPDDQSSYASGTGDASVNAMEHAHVKAVTPGGQEVETITAFGTPAH
jgi:hypothetical protein